MIFLVLAVLISATILFLVKSGVIKTKDSGAEISVLNTEFLPIGRSGTLVLKQFDFCGYVDENYDCVRPGDLFYLGDSVYFRFVVESSSSNNEIFLIENYRLLSPSGKILLDVNEEENFYFNLPSNKNKEEINFKDFFIIGPEEETGEYTFELFLENPSIGKKITLTKHFLMEDEDY